MLPWETAEVTSCIAVFVKLPTSGRLEHGIDRLKGLVETAALEF